MKELRRAIGEDDFKNWIEPITDCSIDGGVVTLTVPTMFSGEWISRTYGDKILRLLRKEGPSIHRVAYRVAPSEAATKSKQETEADDGRGKISNDTMFGARLDPVYTFQSFVVGKQNEMAHAAAWRVSQDDEVEFNPLFLYGGVGLGKTHLMHAIGWALKSRNPDAKIVYLSAEQFMYQFVWALKVGQMMEFKNKIRSVNVLMIDDVQFIAGKDSTQEEFFHTFNSLVNQKKKIILSGDRSPGKITGLGDRIKSRLQSGLVADLHTPDYELRLGILQHKAKIYRQSNPKIVFEDDVLDFLAQRIRNNVRVLEGGLKRLVASTSFIDYRITVDIAQNILADILNESYKKVEVEAIIEAVAEYYNMKVSEIIGRRRTRNISRARQAAMFLAKSLTTKSLPEIGRSFGGRDHTTVIHSLKRITELRKAEPEIAEDLEKLRRIIEA